MMIRKSTQYSIHLQRGIRKIRVYLSMSPASADVRELPNTEKVQIRIANGVK